VELIERLLWNLQTIDLVAQTDLLRLNFLRCPKLVERVVERVLHHHWDQVVL
jgi:hypothetical protein